MNLATLIFVLVYFLLISEKLPKVAVALLGGSLLILTGVITQQEAFAYVDFNVIFLLVGMMILVNILRDTGLFNYLTGVLVKQVGVKGFPLLITLAILTAACSALLDNVTTVLFMATITCELCKKFELDAKPFLITETITSNIGGTATIIGDPPNIMIGSAAKLSFMDFIVHITPIIIIILPVSIGVLCWYYRKQLKAINLTQVALDTDLYQITQPRLLRYGLSILFLVIAAFVFHHWLHQEVGTIAMAGAALLMCFEDPKDIWNDVEWDTIFFFIGLFMIVGALEKSGTLNTLSQQLILVTQGDFSQMTLALLWGSGILSAIVDNIPYTATMIPIIQNLKPHYTSIEPLWWALSLGACLGGNATLIGATANVVVADIAKNKGNQVISFIEFSMIGSFITLISLIICSIYLWARYLIVA